MMEIIDLTSVFVMKVNELCADNYHRHSLPMRTLESKNVN